MSGVILTPTWLTGFDERLQVIQEDAYNQLTANMWWQITTKQTQGLSRVERNAWIVETARIRTLLDGEQHFGDLGAFQYEYEHKFAGDGIKLNKAEFTDKDGNGINAATSWNKQIAAWMAYWPQEQTAIQINANPIAYDGKAYFAVDHPTNPLETGGSTYSNLLSFPLSEVDTPDLTVAVKNLGLGLAHIRSKVLTPNGKAPRRLRPTHILHPPAMTTRIQQLTSAKFIAQSVGTAGGSGDVEGIVRNWGLQTPVEAAELSVDFGGDDKSCYIVVQDIVGGELGGFIYSVREDFEIINHMPTTDAELARTQELQWTAMGRNVVTPGHPFAIFKMKGT